MKKTLLLLAISFGALLASAQAGKNTEVTVPITSTSSLKGFIYLPKDYDSTKQNYPVAFFYHGVGEAGTKDSLLFRQGLPYDLVHGNTPDSIISPVDGKYYSFIVLYLQSPSWSVNPGYLGKEINWLKARYRIDTNRLYVTGLSAGGQCAQRAFTLTDSVARQITAAVIFSAASYSACNYSLIAKYNIHTWYLCGLQDNVVGTTPTKTYHLKADSVLNGSSVVSWYTGAHTGWIGRYLKTYRDPVTGLSVWQWLLLFKKENKQS